MVQCDDEYCAGEDMDAGTVAYHAGAKVALLLDFSKQSIAVAIGMVPRNVKRGDWFVPLKKAVINASSGQPKQTELPTKQETWRDRSPLF